MGTFYKNLVRFAGSKLFFVLTTAAFTVQTAWIAISSRFPMAFDEAFHLGLIKIHSHQLSPLIMHQPPGPASFGALVTDPSYLYYWFMGFIYRLVTRLTPNFMNQIITMRLLNVAMFTLGIILFWLVLRKTKVSPAVVNVAILFFTLTPVVGLLAAHINYDNLLMPCIAGSLLLTLHFRERLIDKRQFSSRSLIAILILCALASLIKYPFLPIFAGIIVYLVYLLWTIVNRSKRSTSLLRSCLKDWAKVPKWQKVALLAGLVLSLGLFSYTYGTNIIVYHNPVPQCGQVLGPTRCQAYGPWARNYRAAHNIVNGPNIFYFVPNWIGGMFERLFFVVNGSTGPAVYQNYIAPLLAATAALGGSIGLFLFARHGRRNLLYDRGLSVLMFVGMAYMAALWGRNYHDYVQLGQMVAINGRYLVLVILPFYVAAAVGWQQWLAGRAIKIRLGILAAAFLLCLQGGGIVSYMVYSNQYWYWPNNKWVQTTNKNFQKIIKPFVWAPKIR